MKWSWTIGRVSGIELRMHATFLILLAWLALLDYQASKSLLGAAVGVLFALALFACVLLHELGHAVAGRRVGVATRDITLLPIGGVARLEEIPRDPRKELRIALAGPAVTLLIVVVLFAALSLSGLPVVVGTTDHRSVSAFVVDLAWLNVAVLVFNLLPAFPMDGGRVLRALLALRVDYARATEIAARVGRMFALLFGLVGLLYNPLLVLIAFFIWISAAAESAELQQRTALSGIAVDRLMIRDVRALSANDTLNAALEKVLTGFQHDFPVIEDEKIVGVLTQDALVVGLARRGTQSLVSSSMATSFETANPNELVNDAVARLRKSGGRALPVVDGGRFCGLLTSDSVAEFVLMNAALKPQGVNSRGAPKTLAPSV